MHKLSSVVVAILLAACGGGTKAPATTPTAPTTTAATPVAAPAAGGVELGELKFYAGDELGMQLQANGHLQVAMGHAEPGKTAETSWQDVAAIGTDGSISGPDGKKHGQIKADGSFVGEDGKAASFHFEGDTLVVGDQKITIDDKGILQGGQPTGKQMRIEGATTPGLKRTALVLLALLMSADDGEGQAPAQGGGGGGY